MGEHDRSIFGNVLVKQDASLSIAQEPRRCSLPLQEWRLCGASPLCSIKSKAYRIASRAAIGSEPTASPSIVNLLALISSAAAAIPASLTGQSRFPELKRNAVATTLMGMLVVLSAISGILDQ
jgi:hypothetical protein